MDGKVALVTGASRGIGRSIALALAEAGADVALNYRTHADEAENAAEEVRERGRRAHVVQADVADAVAVDTMVSEVNDHFGRLDLAIANAAFSERGLFYELPMDAVRRTVDVTLWGAYHLLRSASRSMIRQGDGGSIVIISSPRAFLAVPHSLPYNMSKAAIDQMARTAAIELVDHRIRVNLVHPGWIDTPGERKFATENEIRAAAGELPWGRLGRPDEIGRAVVFLCDSASDYINGSSLLVDGAITLPSWTSRVSAVPE